VKTRQLCGTLACAAVFLAGAGACSDSPDDPNSSSATIDARTSTDAAELVNLGIQQGQSGKMDEAKATFERVLTLDATNKFAWFNLGYIAQSRNQVDDAIRNYDKALQADGSYKPALYNKAIVTEGKEPKAAIELYQKILAVDDKSATAHLRLGILLAKQGDQAGANREFQAAVDLDGTLVDAIPPEYRSSYAAGA
jgi:Tfp pilus assembly protein PilF